ncbi:hypothetical protein ISN44_As01g034170 [Arabidopsis suecica]|uniref:Uncharacterized protein n=1 Tax=Arabidopsis suecica TaxID=45249 RepID=A0A8T2H7Y7_ARASU|nr:hypothetical protein ISN44_As01g034170 [Arabidopsis suecica]
MIHPCGRNDILITPKGPWIHPPDHRRLAHEILLPSALGLLAGPTSVLSIGSHRGLSHCIHGRPLGVFGCTYPCASSNTFLDPSHPTIGLSDPFRQTIDLSHPTRPTIGLSDPICLADPIRRPIYQIRFVSKRNGLPSPSSTLHRTVGPRGSMRIRGEWMLPEASHPFLAPFQKVTSVPCTLSKGHIRSLHPLGDATVRWYPLDLTPFGRETSSPVSYHSPSARVSADQTTQLDCIHGRPLGVFGCTYPCASSNTFLDPSHPTIGLSDPFRQTIGLSHPTRPTIGLSHPICLADPIRRSVYQIRFVSKTNGLPSPSSTLHRTVGPGGSMRIRGEWMLPEASHPFLAPFQKVTSVPCTLPKGHIRSLHPLGDATVRWYPLDLTPFGRETSSPVSYHSPSARVSADQTTQLDCIHGRPLGVFGCTYPCASSNTFLDPSHPTIGLSDPFRQTIGLSHPTRPTIGLSHPICLADPIRRSVYQIRFVSKTNGLPSPSSTLHRTVGPGGSMRIRGEWMLPEASHPFLAPFQKVTSVPCTLPKGHIRSLHPLGDATVRWYPLDLTPFGRETSSPVSYHSPSARVSADQTTQLDCIHGRPLGVFGCTYPCASSNTFLDPSHPTIGLSDPFRQTIGLSHPTRPTIGLSHPICLADPIRRSVYQIRFVSKTNGLPSPCSTLHRTVGPGGSMRIRGEWMLPEASHPFLAPFRKVTSVPCTLPKGHIRSLHPLGDATVRWYPLDLTPFGRETSSPVSYHSPSARVSADQTTKLGQYSFSSPSSVELSAQPPAHKLRPRRKLAGGDSDFSRRWKSADSPKRDGLLGRDSSPWNRFVENTNFLGGLWRVGSSEEKEGSRKPKSSTGFLIPLMRPQSCEP